MKNFSSAKITRPTLSGVFPRKRLFKVLDNGRKKRVTWVSGPAGSGKTTLIASYLDARKLSGLWYQLDGNDADIATFFYYLGLAAQKAAPRYRKALPLLTPEYLQGISTFTRRFFEKLYSRLKPPFTIVFDNYQEVSDGSRLNELLNNGLSFVPEGIRVFVLSRKEPPSAFMRLLANSTMDVVGWNELRFTPEESRRILRLKSGRKLTEAVVEDLYRKTDGWVAGLVLMTEGIETEKQERLSAGTLSQERIFDYFTGEILDALDGETRDFLLMTAFLPRMTVRTAEKLTDRENAGPILSALNRNHFFTEKHPTSEPSYQYHPLFREFLLTRVKESLSRKGILRVQQRAVVLLEGSGQTEDAAALLAETGDWNGLARLILAHAQAFMKQGRTQTLQGWLTFLPRDILENAPWLLYWLGVCRFPFSFKEGRGHFEKAFHLFNKNGDVVGALLSWAGAVDTIAYEFGDLRQMDSWVAWFNDHIAEHPAFPSPEIEFRVTSSMMIALMFSRTRHGEISPWVERALRLVPGCPDVNARLFTATYIVLYYVWLGDLNKAGMIVKDQKAWLRSPEVAPFSILTVKYADALCQWMAADPDFGLQTASEGLELSSTSGIYISLHHFYARTVFACLNRGDVTGAQNYFDKLKEVTDSAMVLHMIRYQYHYIPAWQHLLQGDFSAALRESKTSVELGKKAGGSAFHRAFSQITTALAHLGLGEYGKAEEHLREALKIAREMKSSIMEFTCLLFEAGLLFEKAKRDSGKGEENKRGIEVLRKALALGREQGYMNIVVWYPSAMTALCKKALEEGIETEYVRQFIRRRNLVPDPPPIDIETWPWKLKIFTLGRFEVMLDDEPVRTDQKAVKRPMELLKALITFGEEGADTGQLIEVLWPDAEGDAGNHAFETNLYRLRKLFANADVLMLKNNRLTLNPRYCWIDARAFEHLVRRIDEAQSAVRAAGRKDPGGPSPLYEKAARLYGGRFLPFDSEQAWTTTARERLRDKFLRVVTGICRSLEQAGKWKAAIEYYQKGIEMDDLAEEFYQGLMTCCQRLGRRADAMKAYLRCKETLSTKLGVEPSPETEAIYQAVRDSR